MPSTTEKQRKFFELILGYCKGNKPPDKCINPDIWENNQCKAWEKYSFYVERGDQNYICRLAEEIVSGYE